MIQYVYQPKRKGPRQKLSQENYRGRYRLPWERKITDVTLETTDKRIAEQRLAATVKEAQDEHAGIIAPKPMRDAASTPLVDHLADLVAHLKAAGRAKQYYQRVDVRAKVVFDGCGWTYMRDVSAESFLAWRERQTLANKTLNHYLDSVNVLFNWMQRQLRVPTNPLRMVDKLRVAGHEVVNRRALTDGEAERLLTVAGRRRSLYLAAMLTGLRRGELKALQWGDVHLDAVKPFLAVRASTTKNGKGATIWLRDDLADALREMKPDNVRPIDRVFRMPKSERYAADLAAAGIEREDAQGRKVDFHALRHTLATNLARAGVPPRVAMEVMRHSDMRLTMKTYTDSSQLPTAEAIDRLPRFDQGEPLTLRATGTEDASEMSKKRSQTSVAGRRDKSSAVAVEKGRKHEKTPQKAGSSRRVSQSVATRRNGSKRVAEGIRTPDPRDHNAML